MPFLGASGIWDEGTVSGLRAFGQKLRGFGISDSLLLCFAGLGPWL